MTQEELLAFIRAARARIAGYRSHDRCQMDLDCELACDDSTLAAYANLLEHDGAVTARGVEWMTRWATAFVECVDLCASECGLVPSDQEVP